jgi:hypothetical protein
VEIKVCNGNIAHLTRECHGAVHDRRVVDVTFRSFEKVTHSANPHSGAWNNDHSYVAKKAANLGTDSSLASAFRWKEEGISHTRNNWICYDLKNRRIMATQHTIHPVNV